MALTFKCSGSLEDGFPERAVFPLFFCFLIGMLHSLRWQGQPAQIYLGSWTLQGQSE